MKFEKVKEYIDDYLKFSNDETLNMFYRTIMTQIEILQNDEELPEYDEVVLKESVRRVASMVLDEPLNIKFCRFVEASSQLLYNWNSNVLQDPDVEIICIYMKKMIDSIMFIKRSLDITKRANEKFDTLRGWIPAAYDISEEYLDELLKESK
jgi:hypothetical protein